MGEYHLLAFCIPAFASNNYYSFNNLVVFCAEPEGKALNLSVNLGSYPHLSS